MKIRRTIALMILPVIFVGLSATRAEPPAAADAKTVDDTAAKQAQNHKHFEQLLSGVKLVGRFTVLGREDGPLPKEEYTITSVKKLPNGDFWLFNARVKYGDRDVTLPMALRVKWADDTPVVTLTDLTIPGLGTFSSRVVFYNNKYAGTWTHGNVGGHLFGTIQKLDADPAEAAEAKEK